MPEWFRGGSAKPVTRVRITLLAQYSVLYRRGSGTACKAVAFGLRWFDAITRNNTSSHGFGVEEPFDPACPARIGLPCSLCAKKAENNLSFFEFYLFRNETSSIFNTSNKHR